MLATTIGIGIYKHTCFATGYEASSVYMVAEGGHDDAMPCCAKKQDTCDKKTDGADTPGCCDRTAEFYQLDIPQKNQEKFAYQAPVLPVLYVITIANAGLLVADNLPQYPLYNNLPPPGVGQHLAKLQVYRL